MSFIPYILVRALLGGLGLLPRKLQLHILYAICRIFVFFVPRYRRIAHVNLGIAYPELDEAGREKLFKESCLALARLIVDFIRLPGLSNEWVLEHVECPFWDRYLEIKKENPGKGILIATGHLSSFELLAAMVAVRGHPLSFVVRNFPLARLDRWWTSQRERFGNRVIGRKGAFKEIQADLSRGRDVGILFDQNVTINHAAFVKFFSKEAATTKTVGISAIRAEAPVIVASIQCLGPDRYRVNAVECDFKALYADESLSSDEKVLRITQEVSRHYEAMIRQSPSEWFWMHRRWKTRPEGEAKLY